MNIELKYEIWVFKLCPDNMMFIISFLSFSRPSDWPYHKINDYFDYFISGFEKSLVQSRPYLQITTSNHIIQASSLERSSSRRSFS